MATPGDAAAMPEGLLRVDADGRAVLLGGWSPTSGRYHFPLAQVCPYTGAGDVEPVELPTQGTLWAWTAVTAAPPGYHGPIPYGFGVVELDGGLQLDGGLRVVGRLTVADPSRLEQGQAMQVVHETLPTGPDGEDATVTVWAFAPA